MYLKFIIDKLNKIINSDTNINRLIGYLESCKNVGKGAWHKYDVYEHTLVILEKYEQFLEKNTINIPHYKHIITNLDNKIDEIRIKELLKIAIIFHDIGKPESIIKTGKMKEHVDYSLQIFDKLKTSLHLTKNQLDYVREIIKLHHFLDQNKQVDSPAILGIALLSYFDIDSTRGERFYEKDNNGVVVGEKQVLDRLTVLKEIINTLF